MWSPATKSCSKMRLPILALALALFSSSAAWAQDQPQEESLRAPRTTRDRISQEEPDNPPIADNDDALPADRIIQILQEQPDALDDLKGSAAQWMQEHGRSISPEDISDEMLFARIEQDAALRVVITQQLKNKGYLADSDLDALAASKPPSDSASPAQERKKQPSKRATAKKENESDQNQAAGRRALNPYPGLPALQDLYRQVSPQKDSLQRFGAEIFQNGTGNLDHLPMDLPAGSDYVLGPGDGLNINIWGSVSQRFTRPVDREGRISLPETGDVLVAGRTLAEAQQVVEKALHAQFREANVDLSLSRLRTIRVYVVGDVSRPGAYDISSLSTPLNALYAAGGPTPRGSLRSVRHYRGDRLVRDVDLYDLLLRGVRSDSEHLQAGDTILVPPVGPQVTVSGMVRRPAIYELKQPAPLSEMLELAGGALVTAALRQINVERVEAHEKRVMLSVQLPPSKDKPATDDASFNFRVQDGDRVIISPILPFSDQTVYMQGHVFRPGKYPYHEGIQISELIRSYQDLLPEPADHAEIIRLEPPDYRPTTIMFNLHEVLGGDDPIELRPFDTIRIFGRYEVDPPQVSVYGDVLRPGKYPLAQNMTATDLVRMAGGFKRSAFTARADVTSYVVQNGARVRTEHQTVELAKALAGNTSADLPLKPGDVLTIHQLSGWKEIGSAVTIKGEVQYAGTYGIEEGEKLSSLLLRAGGFRVDSYPEGAVLERVQVKQLAEKNRQELIQRIDSTSAPKFGVGALGDQAGAVQAMFQQRQQILSVLKKQPASGRLVIKISSNIRQWQNTPADIELRAGDVLTIPKKPNFVLVNGQVYNASAITYSPGKNANWYLRQAGGATRLANTKDIYIIRANGSVTGQSGDGSRWWHGSVLSTVVHPGDTIVVPERIIAGGAFWKTALNSAQVASSLAIAARVVTSF